MLPTKVLAQGDAEEWINILFIVVLAVFWLLGGLVKTFGGTRNARAKRPDRRKAVDEEQRKESWQQRLARKADEMQKAAEERIRKFEEQVQPQQKPPKSPERRRPDEGRVTVQAGRGGEPVLVYERAKPTETPEQRRQQAARLQQARQEAARRREAQRRRAAERNVEAELTQVEPGLGAMTDISLGASSRPQPLKIDEALPEHHESASYAASSLIDDSDPDALRKAILHYEILGKPLSLRDPLDTPSAF